MPGGLPAPLEWTFSFVFARFQQIAKDQLEAARNFF
jgi:hypothetical protein